MRDGGNLDAALDALNAVVQRYPEELEAIGWAKFRRAQILDVGGRAYEAAQEARWAWEKCESGEINNPDLMFWSGCVYAKNLYNLSVRDYLSHVCEGTIQVYQQHGLERSDMRENAGWLYLWKAYDEFEETWYSEARADAAAAFQIGVEAENGDMAARARLLEARTALEQGDTLSARVAFQECMEDYGPHMPADYRGEAQVYAIQAHARMGDLDNAFAQAMALFHEDTANRSMQAQGLTLFAQEALARSATDTAVKALALQCQALRHEGTWSGLGVREWNYLIERKGDDALPWLESIRPDCTGNVAAAMDLAIASIYLASASTDAALPYLTSAEATAVDSRLTARLAAFGDGSAVAPVAPPSDSQMLAGVAGDRAALRTFLDQVRARAWAPDSTYADWLDSHQAELPAERYLLEKANWFLNMAVVPREEGDPEMQTPGNGYYFPYTPHRNAESIPLYQEVLASAKSQDDRVEAYIGLVAALARTEQDYTGTLDQFMAEMVDPIRLGEGLVTMGEYLSGTNTITASLPNQNPEVAAILFDLALAKPVDEFWRRQALYNKAFLQDWQLKMDEAIVTLEGLVDLPPCEPCGGRIVGDGNILLARILMHKGRYAEAVSRLEPVVRDPKLYSIAARPEAYTRLAEAYYRLERFNDAPSLLESADRERLGQGRGLEWLQFWVARSHLAAGEAAEARTLLEGLVTAPDAHLADQSAALMTESGS